MTPQELKNSILQLAIQGKLVEQRADEGTGAELLEKILAAKNAEGAKGRGNKLTRSRGARGGGEDEGISNLPKSAKSHPEKFSALSTSPREEIPDDEKPFEIPESWEWVRLGELGILKSGYAFKSTEYTKDGVQVVRISDLSDDSIGLKDAAFYPHKTELSQYFVVDGSFLICMTGSIGKMAWVKDGVLRYLNQRVGMFIPNALCSSAYLWFFLHTSYVVDKWIRAKTSTNGNIKNADIVELLIPLPPLAEQKRIVAKIEELLPLIDCYEKAWSKLEDFNKRFPADMQKSLLQMAIQGKLVEQRADEGTAAELLEKILAAKNAEGAKKGYRATSAKSAKVGSCFSREEISDDEKPFDIPESWEWAKLKDLGEIVTGATPKKSESDLYGGQYPFYKPAELDQGYNVTHAKETLSDVGWGKARRLSVGSVLVTCIGATIGKTGIIRREGTCNQQINAIIPCEVVSEYLYYVIISAWFQTSLKAEASRTTLPIMNKSKFENLMIPLPPLAEQKRIVAKLEELLPLCERLK